MGFTTLILLDWTNLNSKRALFPFNLALNEKKAVQLLLMLEVTHFFL